MPKTTQLVLSLQSKRGVLAAIGRALAEAKVNIISLSAAEGAGRGKIRMVVNKPTFAKRALRKARVRFAEEVAFAKRLSNKPGALARVRPSRRSWSSFCNAEARLATVSPLALASDNSAR